MAYRNCTSECGNETDTALMLSYKIYRIRSIRRRSRIVAALPKVLNEIVAALE